MAVGKIAIDVIASDRASAAFAKMGRASQKFSKKLNSVGSSMTNFGKKASLFVSTPLAAFAASSVKAFAKQEQALANVQAGLESTGNTVGFTLDELATKASDLQKAGIFGDEEILQGVTAQLLTFGNIGAETFDRAQQASVDLAAKLGPKGDLQSSAIMLSKALNDPIANLSAMSRAGVQFGEGQADLVKKLWKTGRQAEAQGIILSELEKFYGGANKAAAETTSGGLKQFSNRMGDVKEKIGGAVAEILTGFLPTIESLGDKIGNLSETQLKWIAGIGAAVVALGPLSFIIGGVVKAVGGLITAIRGVGMALTFLSAHPAVLIIMVAILAIAAIAFLVIKNWDTLKKWFGVFWDWLKKAVKVFVEFILWTLFPIPMLIIKNWDKVKESLLKVWNALKGAFSSGIEAIKNTFNSIKDAITGAFKSAFNWVADAWNNTIGKLSWTVPDWIPVLGGKTISAPKLPTLARGVENFAGGLAMVGERGAEIVHIPKGSNVIPADETRDLLTGGSDKPTVINMNINIYNETDVDMLVDTIKFKLAEGLA